MPRLLGWSGRHLHPVSARAGGLPRSFLPPPPKPSPVPGLASVCRSLGISHSNPDKGQVLELPLADSSEVPVPSMGHPRLTPHLLDLHVNTVAVLTNHLPTQHCSHVLVNRHSHESLITGFQLRKDPLFTLMLLPSRQNNVWSPLIGGTGGPVAADPVKGETRATLASPE